MDLEEHSLDDVAERCEECGARLTAAEQRLALERGGPNLCSVHAADVVALDADDDVDTAE